MTTLYERKLRCAACGKNVDYVGIGSTNMFGSHDLDTRPPEMMRSTISAWIWRCPGCGYCAEEPDEQVNQAAAIIREPEYRRQLDDSTYPEPANRFLCKAFIEERTGNYATAAWAVIHAAWVCDDAEKGQQARRCRSKAVEVIERAVESGQAVAERSGGDVALLVDLLRRAGRLSEALQLIEEKRPEVQEGIILKILDFQKILIKTRDEGCHTVAEVVGEAEAV